MKGPPSKQALDQLELSKHARIYKKRGCLRPSPAVQLRELHQLARREDRLVSCTAVPVACDWAGSASVVEQ